MASETEEEKALKVYDNFINLAGTGTNPYTTLGVSNEESDSAIKKKYLNLARKHHPDRGGAEEKFKIIKSAYDCLVPEFRKYTDVLIKETLSSSAAPTPSSSQTARRASASHPAPKAHAPPRSSRSNRDIPRAPWSFSSTTPPFSERLACLKAFVREYESNVFFSKTLFDRGRSLAAIERGEPDPLFDEFGIRLSNTLNHLKKDQRLLLTKEVVNFRNAFLRYEYDFYINKKGSGLNFMKTTLNSLSSLCFDLPIMPPRKREVLTIFLVGLVAQLYGNSYKNKHATVDITNVGKVLDEIREWWGLSPARRYELPRYSFFQTPLEQPSSSGAHHPSSSSTPPPRKR